MSHTPAGSPRSSLRCGGVFAADGADEESTLERLKALRRESSIGRSPNTTAEGMIRLTKHAQEAISARDIAVDWIEATVNAPDWIGPDPRHPDRIRSYKAITERGAGCCGLCIGRRAMIS